uniref:EGF-like domain-containing protein n=1 Tax=Steinernema glaseri TaxID=37863 RepID=A0A1I8A3S5_9BILA
MRCPVGQWGVDCLNNCTCASDRKQCDAVNGHCQCASGLQGDLCQDYCEVGFWGPDCINQCKCKSLSSDCSATTGECTCKPGYFGEFCDKICPEGQFGDYCKQSCGQCAEGMICDPVFVPKVSSATTVSSPVASALRA